MSSPMKKHAMAAIFLLASTSFAAGCATMNVSSYIERGADLNQYRTFNWGPPDTWSTGDPRLDNNRFFDERVRAQVERQLAARGFQRTTSEQPDVLVHYHASVSQELEIRDVDKSISECEDEDCGPFLYDKGTLVVDLVERRTDKVVWRGWAEASIDGVIDNQAWLETRIDDIIAKILARLPASGVEASRQK